MPRLASFDGTNLAYEVEGQGFPVLLLHGFAADSFVNWVRPGLSDAIVRSGKRVILLDQRGHGLSDKPHDPEAYGGDAMGRDATTLLDHLEIERCDIVGYSMGSGTTLGLISRDNGRFRSAVLGGVGGGMVAAAAAGDGVAADGTEAPARQPSAIADALLAEDKTTITNPVARSFRDFADLTRADKKALAAIQLAPRRWSAPEGLDTVAIPVLVICGDNDPLAPNPQALADRLPNARAVVVSGTHLNVVNNPEYHRAVVDFLNEQP
jgi:pimeloyl-ACP methyl ester carboxylesterase